jgi:hypothetical protein
MMLAKPVLKNAASSLYSRLAALENVANVGEAIRSR